MVRKVTVLWFLVTITWGATADDVPRFHFDPVRFQGTKVTVTRDRSSTVGSIGILESRLRYSFVLTVRRVSDDRYLVNPGAVTLETSEGLEDENVSVAGQPFLVSLCIQPAFFVLADGRFDRFLSEEEKFELLKSEYKLSDRESSSDLLRFLEVSQRLKNNFHNEAKDEWNAMVSLWLGYDLTKDEENIHLRRTARIPLMITFPTNDKLTAGEIGTSGAFANTIESTISPATEREILDKINEQLYDDHFRLTNLRYEGRSDLMTDRDSLLPTFFEIHDDFTSWNGNLQVFSSTRHATYQFGESR